MSACRSASAEKHYRALVDCLENRLLMAATPVVTSLTLINADTDQPVIGYDPLPANATLNLATLPTRNLNIRANTSGAAVGSVKFGLDSNAKYSVDSSVAFALAGNAGNNYSAWTPAIGTHTVKATAYTRVSALGSAGATLSVPFTVVDIAPVSVTAADPIASEPGTDTGKFTVSRGGSTSKALTVKFTMSGTAKSGVDYTALPTSVTIPSGISSVSLTLTVKDDTLVEGNETAVLTLAAGTGYSIVSGTNAATINIVDNDSSVPVNPQSPFTTRFVISPSAPATIQAEDFDKGGEGIAYHDNDAANLGGAYRTNEGVDVEPTGDASGAYNLGHVSEGEWLEYSIDAGSGGTFDLGIRFASEYSGGNAHIEVDGTAVGGTIALTSTGGWQTWTTTTTTGVVLPAGQHVLRLSFDQSTSGGDIGNVNFLQFTPSGVAQNQPTPLAWPAIWGAGAAAPSNHYEAAVVTVAGKIYVFGGFKNSSFQVDRGYLSFDPATNKWTNLGTLPTGAAETHQGITTDGRYIYMAGGLSGDLVADRDPPQLINSTMWRYDTTNNTWSQMANLPAGRGAGAFQLVGRKLHYIGGFAKDDPTMNDMADHFVYDLDVKTWTTAAPVPLPRDHASSVVMNGKIYIMGGETGHHHLTDQRTEMQVYDPAANAWAQLANMPIAKSHDEGGTFILNGQIVMAGGQLNNYAPTDNVIAYDPAKNIWQTLASLPAPRQGLVAQVVGTKIVLALGGTDTDSPENTTWIGTLPASL